jgi:hypothetical protein
MNWIKDIAAVSFTLIGGLLILGIIIIIIKSFRWR